MKILSRFSKIRNPLVGLIVILAVTSYCNFPLAGTQFDVGDFVRGGLGARPLALGGAYVAVAEGSSAGFWNPAGLASQEGTYLGGMRTDKFSKGIVFQYLGVGSQLDLKTFAGREKYRSVSLGTALTYVNMGTGDITLPGGGTFGEGRSLWLASLGYGAESQEGFLDSLSVGTTVKYYTRHIGKSSASGFGWDVGLLTTKSVGPLEVSLGVTSQDFRDTDLQWEEEATDTLPSGYVPWFNRLGLAVEVPTLNLLISSEYDFSPTKQEFSAVKLGAEFGFANLVRIRTGLRKWPGVPGVDYMGGFGISLNFFSIDYTFQPNKVLGDSHIFSASFKF